MIISHEIAQAFGRGLCCSWRCFDCLTLGMQLLTESKQRISQGESWRWNKGSWSTEGWNLPPCPAGTQQLCLGAPPKGNLQLWQWQAPKTKKYKQLTWTAPHLLLKQFTCSDCGTLKCPPCPKVTPFTHLHRWTVSSLWEPSVHLSEQSSKNLQIMLTNTANKYLMQVLNVIALAAE